MLQAKTARWGIGFVTLTSALYAGLTSGIGQMTFPVPRPDTARCLDFSLLRDSCALRMAPCSCGVADLKITEASLYPEVSVARDSSLDSSLHALALQFASLPSPTAVKASIDSFFVTHAVTAPNPATGYFRSAKMAEGLYFVVTAERSFAALWIYDVYFGGLDHYSYYWAWQEDGFRELYRGAKPHAVYDSVMIDANIFSGRPDRFYFVINDPADIAAIRAKVVALNDSIARTGVPASGHNPGCWYGTTVTYVEPIYSSIPTLPIQICGDSLFSGSGSTLRALPGAGTGFKQFLASILIKENPRSRDQYGSMTGSEFVKTIWGMTRVKNPCLRPVPARRSDVWSLDADRIIGRLSAPRKVSIDLLDCRGRILRRVFQGAVAEGVCAMPLPRRMPAAGIDIIDIRYNPERTSLIVPAVR